MCNLCLTHGLLKHNVSLAYHSLCQRMLSVSIAFLTYEGLTCNVRVTYAEGMPSVLGACLKFIDFMASNTCISSFHKIFIKQAFGEFEIVHIKYDHECKILIIIKPSNGLSSPLIKVDFISMIFFCHRRRHGVTSSLHYLISQKA